MHTLLTLLLAMAAPGAHASDWTPVDVAVLDEARGGFSLDSGLLVSLGIERTVTINGKVATQVAFNVPDLGRMSPGQAALAQQALAAGLVQNGPGNVYRAALPEQAVGGMVVQNTLNDQLITHRTVFGISVNSLGLVQAMRLMSTLDQALIHAIPAN